MVITRAYACATPVVASDIAGYSDVVTCESGLLIPPGQSDALGAAVVGLLADEANRVRLGANARQLARSRYSWDLIASRLVEIYAGLLTPAGERLAA